MTHSAKAPPAAIQHQFQAALLHVLRQPHSAQAQLALYETAKALTQTLTQPEIKSFWQVSAVFLEAQALGLLPAQIRPQPLLVRLERQLQQHLDAIEAQQSPQPDLALLHELLITQALLEPRTPALKQLNFNWGLPSVARRIRSDMPLDEQRQALRQALAHLAHQHLSQLRQRLLAQSTPTARLQHLAADAHRLLAALPLPSVLSNLEAVQQDLAAHTDNPLQHPDRVKALGAMLAEILAYRQALSQSTTDSQPEPASVAEPEPAPQPAPEPEPEPAATTEPVAPQNPLLRVLIQDGRQAVQQAHQWLKQRQHNEPLHALALTLSTVSDASHALGQDALSELANALSNTFDVLRTLPDNARSELDDTALQAGLDGFAQGLQQLADGQTAQPQSALCTALNQWQQTLMPWAEPPWDDTDPKPAAQPDTAESIPPHPSGTLSSPEDTTPPWSESVPQPSSTTPPTDRPATGQPKQMVRLPAQWVETFVQLAQTGRKEREQMQAQLSDLDYQLEQLEADGNALLAEFASHSGFGAVSKTLIASLRSVLSLSQSLQLSSQQAQLAMQQQHQLQQRLHDQIEGWQTVPLGRLEYPLQQQIQQLAAQTGRTIVLRLEGAEQTIEQEQLQAWQAPLSLLLTQAALHSFDGAATRAELGKPSALHLVLTLIHANELTLSDDGQGIPLAPLMQRARALDLPAQRLQSTPTKLLTLLFEPQIAHSLHTDPLPGAGPELVAAAEHLQALGGTLHLQSQVGVGTRYTLRLPQRASLEAPTVPF